MGEARARGNYEERKAIAIAAGRSKGDAPTGPVVISAKVLGAAFMGWWRSQTTPAKPSKSWTKRPLARAKRRMAARNERRRSDGAA